MIEQDEHAVIGDLGLSIYINGHSQDFGSTRSGNLGYLAPEQRAPQTSGRPTAASDMYSFAISSIEVGVLSLV